MPRHANSTSFKPGHQMTPETAERHRQAMIEAYASGRLKPVHGPWSDEQRAKHSQTKRLKAIGNKTRQGIYIRIMTEDGYRYEHRVVMEAFLGRKLLRREVVHHKNHDTTDNRLENLELTNPSDHNRLHPDKVRRFIQAGIEGTKLKPGQWSRKYAHCIDCGTIDRPHLCHGRCVRCHGRHLRKR